MADSDKMENSEKQIYDKLDDKSDTDPPKSKFDDTTNCYGAYQTHNDVTNLHSTSYPYKNAREYAQVLQTWLWQYRFFSTMTAFHTNLVMSMPPTFPQNHAGTRFTQPTNPEPTRQHTPLAAQVQHTPSAAQESQRNTEGTGTRYKVPMLWRRMAAECLDFILLFYVKILVTVAVLRQMGYMNENFLDIDEQIPFLSDLGDFDYERMLGFTSELIALEVVNRVCITIVETLCIRQGYAGVIGGATPGKKIMQLRVISYSSVTDLRNGQILVTGERDPGFLNALVRSIVKNFSMAFFFPACLTVFFFRFNRAAYDVLAHTVVVEVERQQRPQE